MPTAPAMGPLTYMLAWVHNKTLPQTYTKIYKRGLSGARERLQFIWNKINRLNLSDQKHRK